MVDIAEQLKDHIEDANDIKGHIKICISRVEKMKNQGVVHSAHLLSQLYSALATADEQYSHLRNRREIPV